MDEVLIARAQELVTLDEQAKALATRIDDLKALLKDALPNGTHVLGCCVLTIKDGSNSHIDKEAMCSFFHVSVDALEPFTKRSTFRTLSAKRATIKE
jgi:hypothetical protein